MFDFTTRVLQSLAITWNLLENIWCWAVHRTFQQYDTRSVPPSSSSSLCTLDMVKCLKFRVGIQLWPNGTQIWPAQNPISHPSTSIDFSVVLYRALFICQFSTNHSMVLLLYTLSVGIYDADLLTVYNIKLNQIKFYLKSAMYIWKKRKISKRLFIWLYSITNSNKLYIWFK